MPDQITETKSLSPKSLKSKFSGACGGVVIGLALFFGSFAVLYSNEGRVDMSTIAKDAIDIKAETLNTEANAKLVDTTGKLASDETIGDSLFLKPGKYIAIDRKVEVYAWVEEEKTETDTNSNTETTTYNYTKEWVETPADSADFKYPAEHTNPTKKYENERKKASKAQIGVYQIEMSQVELPDFEKLALTQENVILNNGAVLASSDYLFISATPLAVTKIEAPGIGDMRISYTVLKPDTTVTVFGRLDGANIGTYVDEDNNKLFRMFVGNKDAALDDMHGEYKFALWAFRIVGFLMMWIGLSALFAPITALADVIPIIGGLGKSIIGAITFVAALILTVTTVAISALLHSSFMLVVLVVVILVAVIAGASVILKKKK